MGRRQAVNRRIFLNTVVALVTITALVVIWHVYSSNLADCLRDDALALFQEASTIKAVSNPPEPNLHTLTPENIHSIEPVLVLERDLTAVSTLAFAPNDEILVSGDTDIQIWNTATGEMQALLIGHSGQIKNIQVSSDGNTLASSNSDETVRLWDIRAEEEIDSIQFDIEVSNPSSAIAFIPTSSMLAYSVDNSVYLWDTAKSIQMEGLRTRRGSVHNLTFSSSGVMLAYSTDEVSTDSHIIVCDLTSNRQVVDIVREETLITDVDFSPDEATIVASSLDGLTIIWNISTGDEVHIFPSGTSTASNSVSFSPDGSMIAIGYGVPFDNNNLIQIWDAETGQKLADISHHSRAVRAIEFNAAGNLLASGSADGTIVLWGIVDEN